MSLTREEIRELGQILEARAGRGRSGPPKLRLIVPPSPNLLDPIFREAHLRRIVHLRERYRLHWLVDQATFNAASLSCLEDCDLIRLLADMERARECIADGISFEDAGLIRAVEAPSRLIHDRALEYQADLAEIACGQSPDSAVVEHEECPF